MKPRLVLAVVLLLTLSEAILGANAAARYLTRKPPTIPAAPARGAATPSTAASMLATAAVQARAWRADAALIEDVSWLSWPNVKTAVVAAPVNGWGTFVFASGGERLAVVVDRGSGFILGQHAMTLGISAPRALSTNPPPITAEIASATAELLGGSTYREACPEHRNLSKVGVAFDPPTGAQTWVVTYADDRSASNPDIIVVMNATTGQVLRKTISNPSCAGS